MRKPTFCEFLKMIYGVSYEEYKHFNDLQKKAIEIDYQDRYGSIKWF